MICRNGIRAKESVGETDEAKAEVFTKDKSVRRMRRRETTRTQSACATDPSPF